MIPDKSFGCVANTIRVRSGRYLDLLNPQPDQFTLEDIAGALSKICRFGGQIDRFYSVADHCVNCVKLAETWGYSTAQRQAVLMHDAAEAFIGDVVKPLKVLLDAYAEIETQIESVIAVKFSVDFALHADAVKRVDRAMLIAERRQFFSKDTAKWTGEETVDSVEWVFGNPRTHYVAERDFVSAAIALGIE
jgi:uncharacterized protein